MQCWRALKALNRPLVFSRRPRTAAMVSLRNLVALCSALTAFASPVPNQIAADIEPVVEARAEGDISFYLDSVVLRNGRVHQPYKADVGGLLRGHEDNLVDFSVQSVSGGEWVMISPAGTLFGIPDDKARDAEVTVTASTFHGSSSKLSVTIPLVDKRQPLVSELSVLSYNLWHGGTQMNDYHAKQVRFLAGSGVDVAVMQETTGGHATRLGDALGWYSWQGTETTVGIISKYPIVDDIAETDATGSVQIELDGRRSRVNVWGVHLGYTPYGPYDFCFDNMTIDQVLDRETESKRTPQITDTISRMEDNLGDADRIPVILAGDFNAPSHLDWIEETKKRNCGVGYVPWPTSKHPTDAGLVDTYREINPDPVSDPAITWSPIYLTNDNGKPEPLDRIDFVYHKGKSLKALAAEIIVVGHPKPQPDHANNEWTSDHKAVLAKYAVGRVSGSASDVDVELLR